MSEQNLLFGVTAIVLLGTAIAWGVMWYRGRNRDPDDRDQADEDGWPR